MTDMYDEYRPEEYRPELPEALVASLARLRHRYGNMNPPAVGAALAAFTGPSLADDKGDLPVTATGKASPTRRRRRAKSVIAMLIGTTTGKIVLGTAVAAASAGIGQWSGVVDIPGLPDRREVVAPSIAKDDSDDSPATTAEGADSSGGDDSTDSRNGTDSSKDAPASNYTHDEPNNEHPDHTHSTNDAPDSNYTHDEPNNEHPDHTRRVQGVTATR
jgi:hypothetical protein